MVGAGATVVSATGLREGGNPWLLRVAQRLRVLGATAAALHAVAVEPAPELPERTRPIPASDFARDRRTGAGPTTPLLAAADEAVRRLPVPRDADGRTRLVHGDLWQGNTMWDGGTLVGLLDWTWRASAVPASTCPRCGWTRR